MDSSESMPCSVTDEEQTGKHSLCKHLENLVFWSYNVQEKRGSMKKLTLENWQELQPYIALADYHEYNSNTMTMLMWTSMYAVSYTHLISSYFIYLLISYIFLLNILFI